MRLLALTGWTKEDWTEAIKLGVQGIVGAAFMFFLMFVIGYCG